MLPARQRPLWVETLAVVSGFTILTLVMTWPLAAHLASALPGDLGDPLLNTWILAWDADRLRHFPQGLGGLWDAPILYPARRTLAFSEHLLGVAIFTAPIDWLTGNPVLTYNLAVVFSFVLAGAGMYLLARSICGRRDAALLAGLAYAFSPYRFGQISHLQVLMSGWMPIGLWALHRYLTSWSWAALLLFTAIFLVQALSNAYFLYFFALPVAIVCVFALFPGGPNRQRPPWRLVALQLGLAAALILIVLAPVASAYLEVRRSYGFHRTYGDLKNFSADVASYFRADDQVRLWGWLPGARLPERQLFPGALVILLAAAAFWRRRVVDQPAVARAQGLTTPADWPATLLRARAAYALVAAAAFVLSLGPEPTAWGRTLSPFGPYGWLARVVPGLDGIRAPARLATIVILALAVLAGIGCSRIFSRMPQRATRLALLVLAAGILAEGFAVPIPLAPFAPSGRPDDRAAYDWLKISPPGAVLELPIRDWDVHPTLIYQYGTLFHAHPIVNGYSGYGSTLQEFFGGPPSPLNDLENIGEAVRALRATGIRYIVVHPADFERPDLAEATIEAIGSLGRAHGQNPASAGDQIEQEHRFGGVVAFRLAPWLEGPTLDARPLRPVAREAFKATASHAPERLKLAFDLDADTRWLTNSRQTGVEWLEIRFDRPRDIGLVRLEMARRSLGDYPRELVIESSGDEDEVATLFRGSVLVQMVRGIVREGARAPIDIPLPANQTLRLRLRQTGQTRTWFWSIHELRMWER